MIQSVRKTNFKSYLDLLDNRINMSVPIENIRWLFKFTNDMKKSTYYCYPTNTIYGERYVESLFTYNVAPNLWNGTVDLLPAGYYKYEVYEVAWGIDEIGGGWCTPVISDVYAPRNETQRIIGTNCAGVVQGLVAIGKLYQAEKAGEEEVQYLEHPETTGTNYIYTS